MTRIIRSLDEISDRYDAVFCDLWGCLHNGVRPFPAAVEALTTFRARGGAVMLLTNAPRPAKFVGEQLDRMGVPRAVYDGIVSSGDAAQDAMFAGAIGQKVWHLGPSKDDGFFEEVPAAWAGRAMIERVDFDEAEGIVCTGPFDEVNEVPEDYRARFLAAKTRGLPMLCANPDVVVDMGDKRIYCAGALAALYEEMGGKTLYFGKPHPPIYDLARRRLTELREVDDSRILAIGDGINTDVAGAMGEGIDVLFITGGLAAEQFGPDQENPDPDLLAGWLGARQQDPQYTVGKLR
ncbi:HAD superfamily hydrolase (TIGR01459 family) [Rhodobacter aestuarii]|uniref:HAD-superfamily class IIA hydrolase, TIGR01459 n=1 Tax=Rhodobacter aestuarii TaxID=453582 RepID=A0A1N7MQH7_9RHOB|nr:TIGR01459 family HAD-type hydrolase [Rhodobacter aestuarii]PTV96619.1 HAD superfamily hydrolase (TIGR01459 family) [Rhodobacter aestuarii]SIS88109.1 HAD-superfamily class IIA hydrolase, TIGR01459 [Rhodobacter aestuarii]